MSGALTRGGSSHLKALDTVNHKVDLTGKAVSQWHTVLELQGKYFINFLTAFSGSYSQAMVKITMDGMTKTYSVNANSSGGKSTVFYIHPDNTSPSGAHDDSPFFPPWFVKDHLKIELYQSILYENDYRYSATATIKGALVEVEDME